ncbi:hypothetical protein E2C01_049005 [Portunus trituberculatus]|uniref:Uncharacterized protein n=1 Tax=Portunus trituberculatus TaxID=210409 RepID=A0A5B7G824_PORTR|nr:hypothetical protein [Portunus trituberculatus]
MNPHGAGLCGGQRSDVVIGWRRVRVLRDTGHFSSYCRGFKNTHMLPIKPVFDGIRFGELWEAA